MLLTDEEMLQIRLTIETKAGLDEELMQHCGHLIHIGAFDEAVRNAFILLEDRLRQAVKKEGMTGTDLANYAFSPKDGPLAKQLTNNVAERDGLRELYSGAFKLFRNPAAHGVVGYDSVQGKAIISLVNLLLKILDKAVHPELIPDNVERILSEVEKSVGPGAASRLRAFVVKCVKEGIKPGASSKEWVPFQHNAIMKYDHWDQPKPHSLTMFYLVLRTKYGMWFPVNQYYRLVVGFDIEKLQKELRSIGFQPTGQHQDYSIDFRLHNDQAFFEKLLDLVGRILEEIESISG